MSDIMRSTNKSLVEDFVMRNNGTEDSVFPEITVDGESTFVLVVSEKDIVRVIESDDDTGITSYAQAVDAAKALEFDIENQTEETAADVPKEDDLNLGQDGDYVQIYRRTVVLEHFTMEKADTLFTKSELEKVVQTMQQHGTTPALLEKYYQLRAGTYNPDNDPAARAYDSPTFATDSETIAVQVKRLMDDTGFQSDENRKFVAKFRDEFFSLFKNSGKGKTLRNKFLHRAIDEVLITNRDLHTLMGNIGKVFKIPDNHFNQLRAVLSKAMYNQTPSLSKGLHGDNSTMPITIGHLMYHLWNNYYKPQIPN